MTDLAFVTSGSDAQKTDATRAPNSPANAPETHAVAISKVDKSFGDVQALNELDFVVPQGKISVLLGPNGAGKTTAIRLITGALPPDAGTVRTFGVDPVEDGESVRYRCGVVAAKPALYDRLNGWDNLKYAAELWELDGDLEAQIADSAGRFGIDHALNLKVGGYSTGMKTRLALARAVLPAPDLLLLDEPTSGLDPESSLAVLNLIRELTDDGRSVIMCTHLLAEAEGLADQVVMLEQGRTLLAGTQTELITRYWGKPAVFIDSVTPIGDVLLDLVATRAATRTDTGVRIETEDEFSISQIVRTLVENDVAIARVQAENPSLEDLYFRIRENYRNGEFNR